MKNFATRKGFEKSVKAKEGICSNWCEEVLLIQSKLRALSQATSDTERMFSLMNFIKSKLTSRITNCLHHRMRAQAHLPRDPSLVDKDYAFHIWKMKKDRYQKEMSGTKKFKKKKELNDLQMSLLNL